GAGGECDQGCDEYASHRLSLERPHAAVGAARQRPRGLAVAVLVDEPLLQPGWLRERVAPGPSRADREVLQHPRDRRAQPRALLVGRQVEAHELALVGVGALLVGGAVAVRLGAELGDEER